MIKLRGIRALSTKDIYINPDKRFAWISNPKVASTSIRQSLSGQAVGLEREYRIDLAENVLGKKIPLDKVIAEINRLFTFAFVRHPEQRLISAYNNKIARQMPAKQGYRPKMQVLLSLGYDPMEINREISFEQFLEVILDSNAEQLDRHWKPQTMVLDTDKIRYSCIGKLEAFESSWREICQALELDVAVIMKLLAQEGRKKQSATAQDNPDISKQQRAAIRAYYREDFSRFEYQ